MSTTVRQALGLMSSAGTGKFPAALLISASIGPSPDSTASKAAAIESGSRMSHGRGHGSAPRCLDGGYARGPVAPRRG